MRILILADQNSAHTKKNVKELQNAGHQIRIVSINAKRIMVKNAVVTSNINIRPALVNLLIWVCCFIKASSSTLMQNVSWHPDIIYAHYLTSYGLLANLCQSSKVILCAWGSDVLKFPNCSIFHYLFIRAMCVRPHILLTTSHYLTDELIKIVGRKVTTIPFGIDLSQQESDNIDTQLCKDKIVIGTIKTFEKTYGIDVLVRAFIILKQRKEFQNLFLLVVGEGRYKNMLHELLIHNKLEKSFLFPGYVEYEEVFKYHKMMHVFVAPSISESFGVSLLEAMSVCVPCVASEIPAFKEIDPEGTALTFFEVGNPEKLAEKISEVILNPVKYAKKGRRGRIIVKEKYSLSRNTSDLLLIMNMIKEQGQGMVL